MLVEGEMKRFTKVIESKATFSPIEILHVFINKKNVFLDNLPCHCLRRLSPHRFGIEDLRISIAPLPAVSLGWRHVHATIKWQRILISFFSREFWLFSYYDQWPFLSNFKVTDALVKKIG